MKTSKAFILRACYVIESATITSVWQRLKDTQRRGKALQWKGKGKKRLRICPYWRLLAWRRWRQEDQQ